MPELSWTKPESKPKFIFPRATILENCILSCCMLRPRHPAIVACPRGCRNIARTTYRAPRRVSARKSLFPHGFSATEHLVPPSEDNSTPITDALPRSPLLDPTTYKRKQIKHRAAPPDKSLEPLTAFEQSILENPFGISLSLPSPSYLLPFLTPPSFCECPGC